MQVSTPAAAGECESLLRSLEAHREQPLSTRMLTRRVPRNWGGCRSLSKEDPRQAGCAYTLECVRNGSGASSRASACQARTDALWLGFDRALFVV
jgi:hypothetical protein